MSSTGTTISRSSSLATPASTISHSLLGPTRNFAIRSNGRWVADKPIRWEARRGRTPLRSGGRRPLLNQMVEPLQRQRQVRPPLGLGDRVDLVDDHRLDAGEDLAGARGEHQVERLGGGDQDVGRRFAHRPALFLAGVAGAQADRDVGADAAQRRAQVALDVVGERLQRRDVDEPDAVPSSGSRAPACRCPRGSWRASCRSRSGRRSARWRHRRSPPSRPPARASAPRRRPRTSA